jgi:hypothetical protein
MITELGHFALILAFGIAIVQMIVPLVGAHKGWRSWMAVADPAAISQLILVGFSFAALTWAFMSSDFSLKLVFENSHSAKPMLYKIAGTWGNHEGSMLLWLLILTLFGASAALFGGNLPATLKARVLAVQSAISVAFFAFILFTSNPPAGSGPRLPSALPLSRLRRPLDGLLLRPRGADRRPCRCRLGPLGPTVDAGGLGLLDHRHRAWIVVGLLRAWLGRLLVLGSG